MPPLRLSLPHRRAPSLYLPPSPSYTAFIHRHINIFRGGVVTCIYAIGIGEEALQLFYQTHLLCFFLFLLEKYTPMAMTMAMATQSLDILEKKWSRVREKQGIEISRLYPDGYLKLREDPAAWIQLNPKDRVQRVRRLELYLDDDDVEEIGDSIGELTHLTYLSIQYAKSLKCLPNVITRLHNLQVLEIRHCYNLRELPANLGELHSLTHLTLCQCYNLRELPASLGELHSLTHLSLSVCNNLQELPVSLGELHSLTHLTVSQCHNLRALPASLGELHSLTHLTHIHCKHLQALPASLGELHSLTHLTLVGCTNLQKLPASLGELHSLTHLTLSWCYNLQELPSSLGELKTLTHFTLGGCDAVKSIPNMKVETLCFKSDKDNHFPSFGKLSNLQTSILGVSQIPINSDDMPRLLFLDLRASQIKHFSVLRNIKNLPKLGILSLPKCFRLETLPFDLNDSLIISVHQTHVRKTWKELKIEMMLSFSDSLTASGSQNHFNISPQECLLLNEAPMLWNLFFFFEDTICEDDAPMLLNLNSYKSVRLLDLSICEDDAEKLTSIKEMSQLTHLYIQGSEDYHYIDLKYLPNTITRLRHLSLQDCDYESFSNCLDMLTNLESLDLNLSENELPDVSVLVSLKCLTLRDWEITPLPDSMAKLSNLKTLVLYHCEFLESLPADMNLVKLKLINTFIHPLPTGLRHLEILHVSEYELISDCKYGFTDYLKELVNLETLSITCNSTKFLPSLEDLLNLRELKLKDCFNLRKMPNLGKLSKLCTLNISGTRIKTLPDCITNFHNLQHLILPKCFKLESLPNNFGKEPDVTIDDIHKVYYENMGFYAPDYENLSEDDSEITSDNEEVVDEADMRMSQEGHNTVQTSLHQLQNLPRDHTPVLRASSEFGQAIINNEVTSPHYIFFDNPKVTQFPEVACEKTDLMGEYSGHVQNVTSGNEVWRAYMPNNENLILHQTETLSIDIANQVEGHHSHRRNEAICEDSQHTLHTLQNQRTEINNKKIKNHQSNDGKAKTLKIDIPKEKIQPLMSTNMSMTVEMAAHHLGVDKSTLKRRLREFGLSWPRHNTKTCKEAKKTKFDVEPSSRDQNIVVGVSQLAALPNNVPFVSNVVNYSSNPTLTRTIQECPTTTHGNMDDNHQDQEQLDIAVNPSQCLNTEPPRESSSTFVVKVTYNRHTGRINFCLTKSIDQLKEEVRNKLKLEDHNFLMEYEDEDQEWMIMNSISDLKHAALLHSKSSSGQSVVRLRIIPEIKSCHSTLMTPPTSQVIRCNIQSDDIQLRAGVESSSIRLKSTALFAPAINEMTLDSFQYTKYLPVIMHPFLEGWLNVNADGNCGFRVVADAFHGGEDNWAHARRSMYNVLGVDTIYERLYGGEQYVGEAMNRILWDNSVERAPLEHWMRSMEDLYVIATFYNCVVIYFSFEVKLDFHTILPLRALSGIQGPYGELAIAYCGTQRHYVRVFLSKDAPLPPVASNWHRISDQSVRGWVENYSTRLVVWEKNC